MPLLSPPGWNQWNNSQIPHTVTRFSGRELKSLPIRSDSHLGKLPHRIMRADPNYRYYYSIFSDFKQFYPHLNRIFGVGYQARINCDLLGGRTQNSDKREPNWRNFCRINWTKLGESGIQPLLILSGVFKQVALCPRPVIST